jgi:hypothetical protein
LRTPELNQNILFLIEEIILTCLRAYTHRQILSYSIGIIENPILQDIQGEYFPLRTLELTSTYNFYYSF